jgi:hypothetical protein
MSIVTYLQKDAPLNIDIVDDKLVISIGISTLAYAIKQGLANDFTEMDVTNELGFAQDVIHELEAEDDEGSNRIHKMFDQCAQDAIDNGTDHVRLHDEDED